MFLTLWKNVMRSGFVVNILGTHEKGFGHTVPSASKSQRTDAKKYIVHRLFASCGERGLLSSCGARASHGSGFSCGGARALGRVGFRSGGSWLLSPGSVLVEHGLSGPRVCVVFLDLPCSLH